MVVETSILNLRSRW